MSANSKHVSGFTLIEVLVAMLVLSFMAVGISQISGTSAKASRSIATKTQEVWAEESQTLSFIEALSEGRKPTVPENLEVNITGSGALTDKEAKKLKEKGYLLNQVTVVSKKTNEILWQGTLLSRDTQ